jgi:hypothetical protein
LRGLGQPLKSFRDSELQFPIYGPGQKASSFLSTLGPLALPERGSRAGINVPAPGNVTVPPDAD